MKLTTASVCELQQLDYARFAHGWSHNILTSFDCQVDEEISVSIALLVHIKVVNLVSKYRGQ